jgi:hypothetical protein
MPADKLGRYMRSPKFLNRADEAIAEAVRNLESRGIRPVYLNRKTGRIVGDGADATHENGSCEVRRVPDILKNRGKSEGAEE